jgi:hypothetical protein
LREAKKYAVKSTGMSKARLAGRRNGRPCAIQEQHGADSAESEER